MAISVTCEREGCANVIDTFPCRIAAGRDRFCSRDCYVATRTHVNRSWGKNSSAIREMTQPERAWLAAMVDGEGCISIDPRGYGRLTVVNTCRPLLERCAELTGGGSFFERPLGKAHWKQSWSWQLNGLAAVAVLSQIRPYLIAKTERADALLQSPIYRSAA